ncbi:hypothetical protein CGRA01v4_09610 [Colletotrichum graminicola]|nr:hypothetical protein CGRA01v4_09610 [Colletotrichum graminicola]
MERRIYRGRGGKKRMGYGTHQNVFSQTDKSKLSSMIRLCLASSAPFRCRVIALPLTLPSAIPFTFLPFSPSLFTSQDKFPPLIVFLPVSFPFPPPPNLSSRRACRRRCRTSLPDSPLPHPRHTYSTASRLRRPTKENLRHPRPQRSLSSLKTLRPGKGSLRNPRVAIPLELCLLIG